jgi:hypothetical protein
MVFPMIIKFVKELKKQLEVTYKEFINIITSHGGLLEREKQYLISTK